MTHPLVEHMARAMIIEAKRQNPDVWHDWLSEGECGDGDEERHATRIHSQHEPLDFRLIALAALRSMLEPTEDMVSRGRFALESEASCTPEQGVIHGWNAMIQHVLQGEG